MSTIQPAVLDTDILSELGRGNLQVRARTGAYLAAFGRLTITAVTVFERRRGYHLAIRDGHAFQSHLRAFDALVAASIVLPFDEDAADVAARIWSAIGRSRRQELEDILIAAIAITRQLPLVTRNRKDFEYLSKESGMALELIDWSKATRREA